MCGRFAFDGEHWPDVVTAKTPDIEPNYNISPQDKVFYTTGRLTTEMVIKTVQMQIPVLVSRSGFTAEAVDLARRAGLTLIGRAKGRRFIALSGIKRIVFDTGDDDEFADAPSLQRTHQSTGR